MKGRLIAIGDIHGCHQEFEELLARLDLRPGDRLVLLGDLINRGPDSRRVVQLAREHNAISVAGNHELRLLKFRKTGRDKYLKEGDRETYDQMDERDWSYLEAMPLTWEEPEHNLVLVHGGFLPQEPWRQQPAEVVTRIQVIDPDGNPAKRADHPESPAWADFWEGPPFVVYGHTPRPEVYASKWALGIDTGCVLGGHLTACELPAQRFVQVKARQRYWG